MESNDKLSFFMELVSCAHNIYFTEYTAATFEPVFSNAPNGSSIYFFLPFDFSTAFDPEGRPLSEIRKSSEAYIRGQIRPLIASNSLGMVWAATVSFLNDIPDRIHVMGPVFFSDYSLRTIESRLASHHVSAALQQEFLKFVEQVPVVPPVQFYEYALMLHYTLTGEKITISDLRYPDVPSAAPAEESVRTFHGTYLAEQKLMQMVKAGNLQYRSEMNQLAFSGQPGQLVDNDELRNIKDHVIIFTALCCRAAIEGGLPPEAAYGLSDHYIRDIELADNLPALGELSHSMVDDYIHRVHRLQSNENISPPVRTACEKISLDPQEDWSVSRLAKSLGYTDSYFSKKFKQEVGVGVKEYVTQQRIELAKQMLTDGNMLVSAISDWLGFSTHSSFGVHFRQQTGMTPSEFRERGENEQGQNVPGERSK